MTEKTLYVISDLMFRSRVRETLNNPDLQFAKSIEKSREIIQQKNIEKVIVDLNIPTSLEIIALLRQEFPKMEILAFGSHVLEEKLNEAKENGATKVMPNSGFVKWLEAQRGASWLSLIVFGAIIWAAGWYLFQLIPIYYRYYELDNAFHSISKVANEYKDKELRQRLLMQMKDIGVPGNVSEVRIERLQNSLRVQYSYGEDITLTIGENSWLIQEFFFDLDVSEEPVL